ncbi:hypothetical protein K491DRAFT_715950 [Lophiostoma macrostomum CBS 122681]|uniref:BTB domain-containing protein n=1 Tax=Lophiostoma macrostomum CBS 122681 TaxID=1314788 RepID=A0A6A6T931_9PLEO|nr:hypothetical protein K491DRAFT_715950 [Lophiostoma macrostomum CBS 122681]
MSDSTFPLITVSPIIHLPGHAPLTTTLTPQELSYIFPTLHIYLLPHTPLIASLPSACITHRGLLLALQWHEASMSNVANTFSATFPELIEVCQCLMYFGARPSSDTNLAFMHERIKECTSAGLCREEVEALWSVRLLPFLAPFVTLMVKMVVGYARFSVEIARNKALKWEIQADAELLRGCMAEEDVLRFVEREPEFRERVDEYAVQERERDRKVMREVMLRDRYGYIRRKGCGVTFLAKSAVSCAQTELEVVWEQLQEDEELDVVMTDA